jgi:hypothetical protein
MPLFGPKKVGRLDYAYYWRDDEAIYVDGQIDHPAMEEFSGGYYMAWLTLHQVWSLSLPYKQTLRDALRDVLALGPLTPRVLPVVARQEENRVITLRSTWHQHRSGAIQPVVDHDLGPGAIRRGMVIEEAVVRALTKMWRYFPYERFCDLLATEEGRLALIGDAVIRGPRTATTEGRCELAERIAAGSREMTEASLRELLDDWDDHGFPHGVGGQLRIQ